MTQPFPQTTMNAGLTPPEGFVKCTYHAGPVPEGTYKELVCDNATVIEGRYILIQLPGRASNEVLTLCEVEVYTYGEYPCKNRY